MVSKYRVTLEYLSGKIAGLTSHMKVEKEGPNIIITDDVGGRAQIVVREGIPSIVDIQSVPFGKRYTDEEDSFKKRGFFKGVIKTLKEHGFKSVRVRLQSTDTRAALKRMVETGILMNPRDIAGLSVDEYPTTFDIR